MNSISEIKHERDGALYQGTVTVLGFCGNLGNSMLKLGRPVGRLNFNMGLPILIRRNPNIVVPPRPELDWTFLGFLILRQTCDMEFVSIFTCFEFM